MTQPVLAHDARAALLANIELSRRIQLFCAWCGPGFAVLLFGGWGLLGGFIPLIPPSDSAAEVAAAYAENATLHRTGLILAMIGIFLTVPFFYVISMQMRRTELRVPTLAILQFASGLIVTVVLMIPMLLFVGGAFRPDRPDELTRLINDLSYVMLILPWPPIMGQLASITATCGRPGGGGGSGPGRRGSLSCWHSGVVSDDSAHLTPQSRRAFVPAPDKTGPTDWRTALRHRASRCGIGVALSAMLICAALLSSSPLFGFGVALSLLALPVLIFIVVRQNR